MSSLRRRPAHVLSLTLMLALSTLILAVVEPSPERAKKYPPSVVAPMVATPTRFESKTVAALAPPVEVTVKIGLSWLSTTVNGPTFSSLLIRSEEHTSELQSHSDLVCRLLLEKKKKIKKNNNRK